MAANFSGKDLDSGLVDWVKSEITDAPKRAYDLGKFFFTVSIGTIGVIATLEKLTDGAAWDLPMIIAVIVLFLSMLCAIELARPRQITIQGGSDLQALYEKQIRSLLRRIYVWFFIWLAGAAAGGYAVL